MKINGRAIATVSGIVEGSGSLCSAGMQLLIPVFGDYSFVVYAGKSITRNGLS